MSFLRAILLLVIAALLLACTSTETQSNNQRIAETNTQLGVGYLQQGRVDASLEKFKKALAAVPDYPQAHSSIALAYERIGDEKLAAKHYKRALDLNPEDGATLNNYAAFLCNTGKTQEAEKLFLQAIKTRGYRTPARAYENLGVCALRIPDYEKAEQYLRRALQLDPRLPTSLLNMARISLEQQNYLSGRGYLQRFQELAPLNADGLWIAIQVEQNLGDTNAVRNYALKLRRQFPDANETRLMLNAGYDKI